MTALEIILLILGIAFVIISFFIIDKNQADGRTAARAVGNPESLTRIGENIKQDINGEAGRIIADAQDKLESLSNDKIIAVGEYSDQVIEKIEADHKEVVFLYQMLCDKEEELKEMTNRMSTLKTECERVLIQEKEDSEKKESYEAEIENLRKEIEREKERIREELEYEKARAREEIEKEREASNNEIKKKGQKTVTEPLTNTDEIGSHQEDSGNDADFTAVDLTNETDSLVAQDASEYKDSEPGIIPELPLPNPKRKVQKSSSAAKSTSGTKSQSTSKSSVGTKKNGVVRKGGLESIKATDSRDTRMLSRNDEIIALYKQNKSVMEISRLLQMGQGEVKLIIDLYCR